MTAVATAAPRGPWSKRIRFGWIAEIAGMYVLYSAYDELRTRALGSTASALAHAKQIVSAEKTLGIYWERAIQHAFLDADWFIAFQNVYYGTVHFGMPVLALVWLYRKAPERYVRWRNTLISMWAIAVLVFFVWPLMPPRLMPKEYGFVDTAAQYFNFGPQVKSTFKPNGEPTKHTLDQYGNPFAAMPSFHVGWSTWSVLAIWPLVRRKWLRALLLVYLVSVIFAIVVTANHWLLDVPGGWTVVGLGYLSALGIERAQRGLRGLLSTRRPASASAVGG